MRFIVLALVLCLSGSTLASPPSVPEGIRTVCPNGETKGSTCHVYAVAPPDKKKFYEALVLELYRAASGSDWEYVEACAPGYRKALRPGEGCYGYFMRLK